MSRRSDSNLVPRNRHTLVVGIVARISGCQGQKEMSLEDQEDHGKEIVTELYEGSCKYGVIATKGKGERLDRPELAEIEQMLRTREVDLLVMEDVGRMVRGAEAVRLWGIAVDHGTRCIAPNDCCDTADESWEEDLLSACRDHVAHNIHTSKRLKKKLMNRFRKFGGAPARPISGYIVPPEAKTYDDWHKDDGATAIIQEGARRLRETANCSAVAEWFNDQNFPTGRYRRKRKRWDGDMVRDFYANPILKGFPRRGTRRTIKHHETGRRISVKNPKGPCYYEAPHLAHLTPDEFDELNAYLNERNKNRGRKPVNGEDPRFRVPRKRSRFPGQLARCWYCGWNLVWGANGQIDKLMCHGSRERSCWNSIGADGPLAATKIVDAILAALIELEGFDDQFVELVQRANANGSGRVTEAWVQLGKDEQAILREKENLKASILQCGPLPMLQQIVSELEGRELELARKRRLLEMQKDKALQLPQSIDELRRILRAKFERLTIHSFEFGDLMRQLVPEFHVYLVRLRDGGHLLPRARVKLSLAGYISDAERVPGLSELLTRVVTLDLFEPPQRERIREEAERRAAQHSHWTQRQIAEAIDERPTATAVQHALALDRKMKAERLDSPYVLVLEPPADYSKLRRHRHPRYEFKPVEGYVRPPL